MALVDKCGGHVSGVDISNKLSIVRAQAFSGIRTFCGETNRSHLVMWEQGSNALTKPIGTELLAEREKNGIEYSDTTGEGVVNSGNVLQ